MLSIKQNRLYGREAILRAVQSAAQFAHVGPDQFGPVLTELYNFDRRNWELCTSAERAVPMVLVQAVRDGFSRECFRGETVNFIASRLGVTCCLCLDIGDAIREYDCAGWQIGEEFSRFVCPDYLAVDGSKNSQATSQPLCAKCRRQVSRREERTMGWTKRAIEADECAALLAWIVTTDGFRSRIAEYAGNLSRLRFDPRRPVPRRAA